MTVVTHVSGRRCRHNPDCVSCFAGRADDKARQFVYQITRTLGLDSSLDTKTSNKTNFTYMREHGVAELLVSALEHEHDWVLSSLIEGAYGPILKAVYDTRKKNIKSISREFREWTGVTDPIKFRSAEGLVFFHEVNILAKAGRPDLAAKVTWPGFWGRAPGYDVGSFYLDGKEKPIEVKTSKSFQITRNERRAKKNLVIIIVNLDRGIIDEDLVCNYEFEPYTWLGHKKSLDKRIPYPVDFSTGGNTHGSTDTRGVECVGEGRRRDGQSVLDKERAFHTVGD